jgi:hypothetical protein
VARGADIGAKTTDRDFFTLWDILFPHACKLLSGSTFALPDISSWVMGASF